jgi:hypothetical protein
MKEVCFLNTTLLICNGCILIIIFISHLFTRHYLSSYFNAKGHNLATKEDIEEITEKIEKIRIQYNSEVEKLKALLQITTANQTMINEKKNEVVIEFFNSNLNLLYGELNLSWGDIPPDRDREILYEHMKSVDNIILKIYTDYYKLAIFFMDNEQILNTAWKLVNKAEQIRIIFKKHFTKRKIVFFDEGAAAKLYFEKEITKEVFHTYVEKTNLANTEYSKEMKPAREAMTSSFNEYLVTLSNYYKKLGHEIVFHKIKLEPE